MIATAFALPKVAVLLTVYNGMYYLEEQIQSILQQTQVDLTLFVSIDFSTDGSEIWVNELAKREARIVVLPYGEKFGGAGRNFFRLVRDVDFSSFDYVSFSDQDDIWYPHKLNRAISFLDNSPYDGYSSNVLAFWPDGKQKLINKSGAQQNWDFIFEAAGPGCTYVMTVKLMLAIKKKMLEVWDLLQTVTLHDWFFYAFARAKGYQWFIDSEPTMLYRQHAANQVGVNKGIKAYLSRLKKIKNGWWLSQSLLIAQLTDSYQTEFIQSWALLGRLEFLSLARRAFQCRRDGQEKYFFFFVCLLFAIIGGQKKYGKKQFINYLK